MLNSIKVKMISCLCRKNVIGKDNDLLIKIPSDLKRFKELTNDHVVIMGSKTYESIGRTLPNRLNLVLTRQEVNIKYLEHVSFQDEEPIYVNDFDQIKLILDKVERKDLFVIGGGEIYKLFLPYADELYLTYVLEEVPSDGKDLIYFPEFNKTEWEEKNSTFVCRDGVYPSYTFTHLIKR